MWNERNTTGERRGWEGRIKMEANCKRLLNTEKRGLLEGRWVGRGWARQVMGIKEGACWDERWVSYVRGESLGSETDTMLCVK